MVDPILFIAYVPAALALNLTPGADMLFCLAQGVHGGPRLALAASAGISTGSMVNVTLAGLGLGALVAEVPGAFDAIRWCGVAYLMWLAWRTLRMPLDARISPAVRSSRAFRDGLFVNLTNPKVILFILAFVPQFVDADRPVLPQFLILGAVLAVCGFVINGLVGAASGGIGRQMTADAKFDRAFRWISAGIFGGLALRLAYAGARS